MVTWLNASIGWIVDPANLTALSTLIIALFTVVLAAVGYAQARLIRASIDLAGKEFVSAQRPKIRARNVVVASPNPSMDHRLGIFQPGHPITGTFQIVNIGGTTATILGSHCIVYWDAAGLPMRAPFEGDVPNNPIAPGKLESGQAVTGPFNSQKAIGEGAKTIATKVIRATRLFIMGWVEYSDDLGMVRRTAFCREFKRGPWNHGRFRRVKNKDYEQED